MKNWCTPTYIGWSEGKQGSVESWSPTAQESDRLDNKMIAIDSQPFSIVEDTGFLWLLHNVCLLYAIPSCKYFAEKVIAEMFSTIKLMKDIHPNGDIASL